MDYGYKRMKNKIERAMARLNSRLSHLSPVQIWLIGAADAAATLVVMGLIVAAILAGVQ